MEATDHRVRVRRRTWTRRRAARWAALAVIAVAAGSVAAVGLSRRAASSAQGVARVDGVTLTTEDVATEARARGLNAADIPRQELVDALVARELLAQEARRRGYDRRPTYPSERRRREEQALAIALLKELPQPPPASEAVVQGFASDHADRFAGRRSYTLEVVTVAAGLLPSEQTLDWDEWMRRLQAEKAPFRMRTATLLGSEAPPALAHALSQAVEGGRVTLIRGQVATVYHLAKVEPAPLDGPAGVSAARGELEDAARRHQVADLIERLRRSHRVRIP